MTASATIAPGRPQHLRALARANEVRLARADLKRRVADGEVSAAEVILDASWVVETMPVLELLMSQHRWGLTRCRKLLHGIPMSENKPIGTMTDRQRHALADKLRTQFGAPVRHTVASLEPVLV